MFVLMAVAAIIGAVDGTAGPCATFFNNPSARELRTLLGVPDEGYQSCAIVGSSGLLLYERLGNAIDQHEMVLRLNMAPLKGYEPIVGSKTTIRNVNSKAVVDVFGAVETEDICPPYTVIVTGAGRIFQKYREMCLNTTQVLFFKDVSNPVVADLLHPTGKNIMSGPMAVSIALGVCANGINLYGMSTAGNREVSKQMPYHYYGDCPNPISPYDSLSESDILLSQFIENHPDCITSNAPMASSLSDKYNYSNSSSNVYTYMDRFPLQCDDDHLLAYGILCGTVAAALSVATCIVIKWRTTRPAGSLHDNLLVS